MFRSSQMTWHPRGDMHPRMRKGVWLSWLERFLHTEEVTGSSPVTSTLSRFIDMTYVLLDWTIFLGQLVVQIIGQDSSFDSAELNNHPKSQQFLLLHNTQSSSTGEKHNAQEQSPNTQFGVVSCCDSEQENRFYGFSVY